MFYNNPLWFSIKGRSHWFAEAKLILNESLTFTLPLLKSLKLLQEAWLVSDFYHIISLHDSGH